MPYSIAVATRSALGRRAKHVHDTGHIPAIVYGHGIPPHPVQVQRSEFRKLYRSAGTSSLIDLSVDQQAPVKALIQDVQAHPISLEPFHIDFRQIRMDEMLVIAVPLMYVGEAPAVKELAGTLVHPIAELKVRCLPADLPHEISVDLSALKTFDDAITIGSLQVPQGVTILDDANVTLATVTPPLTEAELKKLEEGSQAVDLTTIKTEAEEKKAAEAAKVAEEASAKEAAA